MSMQEDSMFVNKSTQTDPDPLYIYADSIVENYTKIEKHWRKKEWYSNIILGCSIGLIVIICTRLK